MKKSDLKVGDIVKTREGRYLVILPNPFSIIDGLGTFSAAGCQCYLSQYTDDLLEKTRETHDIIAVYKASEPRVNCFNLIKGIMTCRIDKLFEEIPWDWERPEPVKEMTMEEIEKHFGCKVKIINAEQ